MRSVLKNGNIVRKSLSAANIISLYSLPYGYLRSCRVASKSPGPVFGNRISSDSLRKIGDSSRQYLSTTSRDFRTSFVMVSKNHINDFLLKCRMKSHALSPKGLSPFISGPARALYHDAIMIRSFSCSLLALWGLFPVRK
jgi:hypothetical protein